MANIGRFRERNADIRAAGVASNVDSENTTNNCMIISNPEEVAEHVMRAECKQRIMKNAGLLWQRPPCLPDCNVHELTSFELSKTRFAAFMEKFYEEMYLKRAKLGEARPTGSKPDDVTNLSRTFGHDTTSKYRLYDVILPPKSANQVNAEYGKFHNKYVLSHNHYFPSEQVNRGYKAPFNKHDTFGGATRGDTSGQMVKRCMEQCAGHVIIISKEQMDFIDRTYERLGKKYKKYPYPVPQYMTYGTPTYVPDCDCKMLIEDISPCTSNKHLIDALGHLNMWRHKLQKHATFHMFDLLSVLEHSDKEKTRHLPLRKIFEVMHKMYLYVDIYKMRTALSHFKMILDECCPTERVNYDDFCHLLNIQHPLPPLGNISTMPANVYNKDTTYRRLCEDRKKRPNEAPVGHKHKPVKLDNVPTTVKELMSPNMSMLNGLTDNDFQLQRSKEQLEMIFKNIIDANSFEAILQQLMNTHEDQHSSFSVNQFLKVMENMEPAAQATTT